MDYTKPKNLEINNQYIEEKERLASTVKTIRAKRGLTQTEFAFYCGVSQSLVCQIEKGNCEPGLYTLTKLAAFMGLTVCELVWCGYVKY
jgi:DNA-binding XRE family transcriptional regulator